MTEGEEETVWVSTRTGREGRNVVHLDPDCRHLKRADSVRQRTADQVLRCRTCKVCEDVADAGTGAPDGPWQLLERASPEDVPIQEGSQ